MRGLNKLFQLIDGGLQTNLHSLAEDGIAALGADHLRLVLLNLQGLLPAQAQPSLVHLVSPTWRLKKVWCGVGKLKCY